jgi:hypothetical protein
MRKVQIYCLLFALFLVWACGSKENQSEATEKATEETLMGTDGANKNPMLANIELTDDLVKKYMAVLPKLKEKGANMSANTGIEGLYQYKQLENVVQDGGFKDFSEFIGTHAKIAYSIMALEMDANMKDVDINKARDDAKKEMEEALNNSSLTAEQKKQLEEAQKLINTNLETGENALKNVFEQFKENVTDKDKEVVGKFKEELKKVYENQ